MSVADFIENSHHSKQSILCCSGRCGWEPDIDVDVIEARQAATLNELKLPATEPDNDHDHSDRTALTNGTSVTEKIKKLKFGTRLLMKQLALLVAKRETATAVMNESSSEEADEPMMFTPGQIIHLEVTQVDKIKLLVLIKLWVGNSIPIALFLAWVVWHFTSIVIVCRCCSCGLKEAGLVKASWKAREELSGIHIHESMLLDHGPTRTIDFISTLYDQVEEMSGNGLDKKSL